jgi:pyruvate formate lyase activating enzyme
MSLDPAQLHDNPCVKAALLYEQREGGAAQCGVCNRGCTIKPGQRGYCGARLNIDGRLHVITYGDISSISANPIEKKPFNHFYPGTNALTIGGWGCNAACPWCQNWEISKRHADPLHNHYLAPDKFIEEIRRQHCQGTSFSFNEPTTVFFEYSLDVMPKAHTAGYYNTYVTNGYMTAAALERLAAAGLDAMNIDIKGGQEGVRKFCQLDGERVWQTAQLARKLGIWVELTTLVIPRMNDTARCLSSIARRIHDELGAEVPWHVSGYSPAYQAKKHGLTTPTPISTLEQARNLGLKAGLNHVYCGNVLGHPGENSYCCNRTCGALLVRRVGYDITFIGLTREGRCSRCGTPNHFLMGPRSSQ